MLQACDVGKRRAHSMPKRYAFWCDATRAAMSSCQYCRLFGPLSAWSPFAMGVPVGSDLEYVDEVTMDKALTNRHEM